MFPKSSLDLVILSIINEYPDGVKGYTLMKELEKRFGESSVPGPGTFYPRLKKLKEEKLVDGGEDDKLWRLTSSGKKHLQEEVPDILKQSLDFMPQLYKFLMRAIPFGRRLDFISSRVPETACHGCGPNSALFDAESFSRDIDDIPDEGKSIKRLQDIKARLEHVKQEAEAQFKAQLAEIDGVMKSIDQKIARCEAEKASWRRIPIEDGSFGNKEK
ncbi:MAG: PadR family transcriptional regulator [Candidatus Lokiarchaeota archaeon]|nr:PadR family transcriptional regulator [Candidatus Lokiarchaeota archaeon]